MANFFDKLEDRTRRSLSRSPILYAFIGGIGIVLFWRGVWHTTDWIMEYYFLQPLEYATMHLPAVPWWDGPLSFIVGSFLLLVTGVFVSNFIGNDIIISGLKGEKKLAEKTVDEVQSETGAINQIKQELLNISKKLDQLNKK